MAESRMVAIDETAVKRAEAYIEKTKNEKGVRLTLGNVFALAIDELIKTENG